MLAYATSRDGIHWDKPSLGIHKYRGTLKNNVVIDHEGLECGLFKDPHAMFFPKPISSSIAFEFGVRLAGQGEGD